MEYRAFGDIKVSEIGLGTWQLGADWGDVNDSTAEKVLATAVENGVNFFDTADCKAFWEFVSSFLEAKPAHHRRVK